MDKNRLEEQLSELPLYFYGYIDPKGLEFSERIRYICSAECPMYGKTCLVHHILKNKLRHGTSANIAMANK